MEFSFKMLDSLTFDFSLGGSGGSPAPEPMPALPAGSPVRVIPGAAANFAVGGIVETEEV